MSQKLENKENEKFDAIVAFSSLKIKSSKVLITCKIIFSVFSLVFPIDKKKSGTQFMSSAFTKKRSDGKAKCCVLLHVKESALANTT